MYIYIYSQYIIVLIDTTERSMGKISCNTIYANYAFEFSSAPWDIKSLHLPTPTYSMFLLKIF